MSIIIQAGHRSSYSDVIMQKLYERGLGQPSNSSTHNMSTQKIADKLYKIVSREGISEANNKLADNVMVDLLLSNLDMQDWGWSAEKNLFTMDLWQQLEPEVKFILVFDHPSYLLDQLLGKDLTVDVIDQAMSEWIKYHQKMLEIFEAYDDRSVLIEGSAAVKNISNLGEQIKTIANSLQLKSHWQVSHKTLNSSTDTLNQSKVATDYVNSEILKKYPEVIKLFNTLLSKTAIKSSEPIYRTKQAELSELVNVSNGLSKIQENEKYELLEKKLKEAVLYQRETEKRAIVHQKTIVEYELKIQQLSQKSKNSLNSLDVNSSIESLKQENEMLIKQLHHTQERLEKYYLKNQSLDSSSTIVQQPSKAQVYYGAAERIKQDLPYRIGATMINQSKSAKDLANLPLSLAKEYSKFRKSATNQQPLPQIEDYKDIHEAEKVKEHLSYKLGKSIVDGMASPKAFVKLPLRISQEVINFKKK